MSTASYALADSATMLRRQPRHMRRYPSLTALTVGMPIVLLLLFVYVFGGTLGAGLGDASRGRDLYVDYVTPGIILIAVASVAQGTAISVAMDMTEGIIARFRTMAIARLGPDRARRRQPDPGADRDGGRNRRRAVARLSADRRRG